MKTKNNIVAGTRNNKCLLVCVKSKIEKSVIANNLVYK
jgi:hypothetical protein